ncbi:MAG TPA: hypothetical protein VGZ03_01745 [Acidimicrobiales bacterium]|nr:hypothetical protein [Acidimicrobiales bacterium]
MRRHRKFKIDRDAPEYTGPYRRYDIVKEGVLAIVVVALLTVGLAVLFGSPDEPARSLKQWSTADPIDFVQNAATQLDGTSSIATYGPPYNNGPNVQKLGPFELPKLLGVRIPINTAQDFVINPLRTQPGPPALTQALQLYTQVGPTQQLAWATAYDAAVQQHLRVVNGTIVVPKGNYGPVAALMQFELQIARSGALDQALITSKGWYSTDYTKALLFLSNGTWFSGIGTSQHLAGTQWGMMNETNSYPGQAWLWLYTMLYQIPPYNNHWAANADVDVWFTMVLLTALLAFVPFIPGLRSIPRWTRLYRLIWRTHYRELEQQNT